MSFETISIAELVTVAGGCNAESTPTPRARPRSAPKPGAESSPSATSGLDAVMSGPLGSLLQRFLSRRGDAGLEPSDAISPAPNGPAKAAAGSGASSSCSCGCK